MPSKVCSNVTDFFAFSSCSDIEPIILLLLSTVKCQCNAQSLGNLSIIIFFFGDCTDSQHHDTILLCLFFTIALHKCLFLLWPQLKAFEDIWLGLTGTATSSALQSQILVEGNIDHKEKVKVAASKEKECLQYYMGYLKGKYIRATINNDKFVLTVSFAHTGEVRLL